MRMAGEVRMRDYDATEQAYKNGYSAGYVAGRRSVVGGDVVSVVRCKDCKWYCGIGCVKPYHIRPMGNDDFCSYGERRNGNDK